MKINIGDEVTYLPSGHTGVVIGTKATPTGEIQYSCEGEWQGQEYEWLFTDNAINRKDVQLDRAGNISGNPSVLPALKRGDRVTVDSNQIHEPKHVTGTIIGHMMLGNNLWAVWVSPDQPINPHNNFLWRQNVTGPKKKYQDSLYIYETWCTALPVAGTSITIADDIEAPAPMATPVPSTDTHVMGIDKEEIDWSKFKKIRDML